MDFFRRINNGANANKSVSLIGCSRLELLPRHTIFFLSQAAAVTVCSVGPCSFFSETLQSYHWDKFIHIYCTWCVIWFWVRLKLPLQRETLQSTLSTWCFNICRNVYVMILHISYSTVLLITVYNCVSYRVMSTYSARLWEKKKEIWEVVLVCSSPLSLQ